jgi:hypothetical protein
MEVLFMRNLIFLASAFGAAALLGSSLTGCDGGGDGAGGSGGEGGGGPTVDDACKSLAAAVCGQISSCSSFLIELTYGDQATCETRIAARCDDPTKLEASNVTAADIAACAAVYEGRTCADLFDPGPDECRVPGDKDDGAPCATAAECKGNVCEAEAEGSCGTCATPLAQGTTCGADTTVCDAGLYCNPSSGVCEKPAALDEACGDQKVCEGGLSCNSGKCGPLLGAGADCSAGGTCDFAEGLICFALDNTCTKVNLAKVDELCGLDPDTGDLYVCEADAKCDAGSETCVPRPLEGEACTVDPETGNGDCMSGFDCVAGKCASSLPQCN